MYFTYDTRARFSVLLRPRVILFMYCTICYSYPAVKPTYDARFTPTWQKMAIELN